MGLSTFGIGPAVAASHKKYAERSKQRLAFGLDTEKFDEDQMPLPNRIRDLSVANRDLWAGAFVAIRNHVVKNEESNHFHLFLMGCEVAEGDEDNYRTPRHNLTLLDRIQEIRKDCAGGDEVSLSGSLSKKEKLDVMVRLVSRTS